AQRRYADAEEQCRKALGLYQELLGENHPETGICYNWLGLILGAQGKYVELLSLLGRATETYEASRLSFATRALDRSVTGARRSPYGFSAAIQARLNFRLTAWNAAEADLGRGLSDEMATSQRIALTADEQTRQSEFVARLNTVQPQIVRLVSKVDPT